MYVVFMVVIVYLIFDVDVWFVLDVECVNVFWVVGFVCGEGYQVDFEFVQVDFDFVG